MGFINDNFLLDSKAAEILYHEYAAKQPIIDFHCHLPPEDIANNRRFHNFYDIAHEGDQYKWRSMRANGEPEELCTGDAPARDKYKAYARTMPYLLRNPLFHWTQLELKRYFGIETLLNQETADAIWKETEEKLKGDDLSVWGILKQFNVELIGTTDDPTDSLEHHQSIAKSDCPSRVVPTFRPDKGMKFAEPSAWNTWTDKLAGLTNIECDTLESFKAALDNRHEFFHELGGRASDHGLEKCPELISRESEASKSYEKVRSGKKLNEQEAEGLAGYILQYVGELNASRHWVMQLHLGAKRNVNSQVFGNLGPDKGCDSIGGYSQIEPLANLLYKLSADGKLPKLVLYTLDPSDNYRLASMCGNFFQAGVPGKMQFGSGWWFLDQLEGMTWQINTVSNLMLLRRFIGMLTDSRSFMSFPRHEYFRRLLCNIIGEDIERGLIPEDMELCGQLIQEICYDNAKRHFNFN